MHQHFATAAARRATTMGGALCRPSEPCRYCSQGESDPRSQTSRRLWPCPEGVALALAACQEAAVF